jgi:hypothetical protein
LGFADDHGVERAGDAEEMADGVAVFEMVEMAVKIEAVAGFGLLEEAGDLGVGVLFIVGGDDDLDAVAGGEDEGFLDAVGVAEAVEGLGERGGVEGEAFADFDGSGAVIEAGDVELHLANRGLKPVWEIQVSVEKRRT